MKAQPDYWNDIQILKSLKPKYKKNGRPTKAEREAAGFTLKRTEWDKLWAVRHGRNWGGRRRKAGWGSRPKHVSRRVKVNFMVDIALMEKLNNMPRGIRSQYVNKALDLLMDIEAPEHVKRVTRKPRANPESWKQRPTRMDWIERHRLELERAEEKLRAWKAEQAEKMLLKKKPADAKLISDSL